MCEEEAAAEKLRTDHNHPFPIHTALFVREEVGVVGKEGRSDGKPGKKSGWSIVLLRFVFVSHFPNLFYLAINGS